MAVILDADLKYKFSFFLETIDPADDARVEAGEKWLCAEENACLENTDDLLLLKFSREDRPWRAEFLPRKLKIDEGGRAPDFISSFPGCNNAYVKANIVSPRLKVLIEEHKKEEDGWQFFPVEILNTDGSVQDTYFIWWVHRVVDALDESSEGLKSVGGGAFHGEDDFANYSGDRTPDRLRLHKSIVSGLSAWIDFRFFPSEMIFVSDEMYESMQSAEITGVRSVSIWSEV